MMALRSETTSLGIIYNDKTHKKLTVITERIDGRASSEITHSRSCIMEDQTMAEKIGIVTGVDAEGWACVLTDRKGGCGGCHSDHGGSCQSCLSGSNTKFESHASNPVGARTGDVVRISIRSQDLFKGAAVLYIMPAVALLVGALAGGWLAGRIGWQITSGNVLGAIAGIVAAVLFLVALDRSRLVKNRLSPTVVEILASGENSSKVLTTQHGCCS
jgi:sigma-E factor negative regulatory protein RseC